MTPHPCASHMDHCDHCYRCDVLGECCLIVAPARVAQLAPSVVQPDPLRDAVVHDAQTVVGLPELVRCDAGRQGALPAAVRLGLVAAAVPCDSRKEATYAPRSRAFR